MVVYLVASMAVESVAQMVGSSVVRCVAQWVANSVVRRDVRTAVYLAEY